MCQSVVTYHIHCRCCLVWFKEVKAKDLCLQRHMPHIKSKVQNEHMGPRRYPVRCGPRTDIPHPFKCLIARNQYHNCKHAEKARTRRKHCKCKRTSRSTGYHHQVANKSTMDLSLRRISREGPNASVKGSSAESPTTHALPCTATIVAQQHSEHRSTANATSTHAHHSSETHHEFHNERSHDCIDPRRQHLLHRRTSRNQHTSTIVGLDFFVVWDGHSCACCANDNLKGMSCLGVYQVFELSAHFRKHLGSGLSTESMVDAPNKYGNMAPNKTPAGKMGSHSSETSSQ